jgi:Leucine-rich repeat (LRR) protein
LFVFEQEEENRQQKEMKEFVRFFSSRVNTGCTDFVVIVLSLCVVQIYGTDGLSTDGLALLDFQNGLSYNNIPESWNASDVSPCNWEGVVCSGSDGLVSSLLLFNAGLYGSISPSLGKLQALKYLNLSANNLTGEIPVDLASCTKLTTRALGNNMLEGSIPAAIGKLQALQNLDLSTNKLAGEIPGELASCTKLTTLALGNNMLNGSIPAAIGKLQALQNLDLSTNKLAGEIPGELASCTKLTTLTLGNNMLNGSIPAAIGKLQALQNLDLSTNKLTGEIPGELDSCTNLKVLKIQSNQLTGSIPPGIYNISNLSGFYINNNNLTGNITEGMWTVCLGASSLFIVFFYSLNECLQLNLLPSTSPSNTFFCWERSCEHKKLQNFGVVFVFPEKTSNGPSFWNIKGSM